MKQIPNLFTLLNLVFGFAAIILILQTGESLVEQSDEGTWIAQMPEKIYWGALCIGIAAVIDFLDGFVARMFKATSDLGAQLDSLADVVSFGVAPGLILYQLLKISFIREENALDMSMWMLAPAVLIPCAGAWRLARFNITHLSSTSTSGFQGLPIPAAALVIASLPLIVFYNNYNIAVLIVNKWFLYVVIILLSWLMVSRIGFMSLKFSNYSVKGNIPKITLAVLAIIGAIFLQWLAVPVVFVVYLLISLFNQKQLR